MNHVLVKPSNLPLVLSAILIVSGVLVFSLAGNTYWYPAVIILYR